MRMRMGVVLVAALLSTSGHLRAQGAAMPVNMTTATPAVTAAVARANESIQELQATLLGRLQGELQRGGPAAAVAVCRDEAQTLTAGIAARRGIAIGRTSHKVRNPLNAPRAWAAAAVASHAGKKVTEASPAVFDLGDRVGVLRPIGTMDFCLTCHGAPTIVEAAIGTVLAASYPKDQATGFAAGDLRGWVWAEVPLR